MSIFKERERCCEATFLDGEPYWHAYTSGKETPLLFSLEEDFVFVMNVIAQAAALFPEVRIIAFEVMNNHFHFVVSADEEAVLTFWDFVRKRLVRSFPLMKGLQITIKPIGDLGALRNNIVYTTGTVMLLTLAILRSVILGGPDGIIFWTGLGVRR
mgnify:CR=1 FL=1